MRHPSKRDRWEDKRSSLASLLHQVSGTADQPPQAQTLLEGLSGILLLAQSGLALAEVVNFGVIVVDQQARPLHANQLAQRILQQNDGLSSGPEGLRMAQLDATTELRQRVQKAAAGSAAGAEARAAAIRVPRPSGRSALELLVRPLQPSGLAPTSTWPGAVVYVSDPEEIAEPPDQLLRQLHGLTPMEGKLASLLMQGNSLQEAAQELGVQHNTGRSHLRRVFEKTATCSQMDLMRRLLRGLCQLRIQ